MTAIERATRLIAAAQLIDEVRPCGVWPRWMRAFGLRLQPVGRRYLKAAFAPGIGGPPLAFTATNTPSTQVVIGRMKDLAKHGFTAYHTFAIEVHS